MLKRPKRVVHVVGARPNYMKIAPLMREMSRHSDRWQQVLVHTGQHYDHQLSQVFFQDLGLPQPDVYLGVGSGSHAEQYARVLLAFEPVLKEHRPDWVIVVGDVNSTLACALCAAQMRIPVAHVEAGLRSFDRSMPEELNRTLTDHLSELLFTSEPSGNQNLAREGIPANKVRFVGNVMIDSLAAILPKTEAGKILRQLGLWTSGKGTGPAPVELARQPGPYILVTLHRPQNVDDSATLTEILSALEDSAQRVPVIFPVHPRTRRRIEDNHLSVRLQRLRLLEPLGYVDFVTLMRHAALVITDSGGVQEETSFLRVPCLTVRPNTERPITLECGTNRLVPSNRESLARAMQEAFGAVVQSGERHPELWDGRAAKRILSALSEA